ncbi:nuclease-related domain-containing protein [Oryzihumus leptocrescens]|uniref:Nuclease-like protein n=1 Tax=Oryzihumus leptocrescens TaxID=297536 RepID=A0A542ZLA2_9MICO|nr:nuclease-related domain-containing protein [Oryzihumus leptocrescens]TQL60940.1 nuclease-like protein [Oryzihumus leptocrescens]
MDIGGMAGPQPEVIRLRYAGRCSCGESVAAGERAGYVRSERRVVCLHCLADRQAGRVDLGALAAEVVVPPAPGVAGGAARRRHGRLVAAREARLAKRSRLVRWWASLGPEPQSTRAWALGALGEERVAACLHGVADRGVLALHDRRVPGRRSNIDHIAVGPAGVFVIDAKRYENAEVRVRRVGGLFTPRRDELLVRGRLRTALVEGLVRQVDAVRTVLDSGTLGSVPVTPVLCFVDGRFPLFTKQFRVGETAVVGPRGLADLVTAPGALDEEQRLAVYCLLAERLRSMT